MRELTVSNDLIDRPEALRARADQDGYLFFRGLLDPRPVAEVHRQILALCQNAGWLADGTAAEDGIAAPGIAPVEGCAEFNAVYDRIQRLEDFHTLAHHPALIAALDALFGEPTLVHARNIARVIFPKATQHTTPAHQDYVHIQGTEATWTAWIPLSDCPRELGVLSVLPGSHWQGLDPVHAALGAGGLGIDTDVLPFAWADSDLRAGDVLMFHSLLVHRGMPNRTPDRIRVSVDYRYQGASQPLVAASMEPHGGRLDWPAVYAGWRSKDRQYYWRDRPLHYVDWSPHYHDEARAASKGHPK